MKRFLSTPVTAAGAILLALILVTPLVLYWTQAGFTQQILLPAQMQPMPTQPMPPQPMPPLQPMPAQIVTSPLTATLEPYYQVQPYTTDTPAMVEPPPQLPQTVTMPVPIPAQEFRPFYEMVPEVVPQAVFRVKTPNVIRVYSLREMLDGFDDVGPIERSPMQYDRVRSEGAMFRLILQIMEEQLTNEYPDENIRFHMVPGKQAIILVAPQPVHDTVGGLLQSLREVCETLKKLEDGGVRREEKEEEPPQEHSMALQEMEVPLAGGYRKNYKITNVDAADVAVAINDYIRGRRRVDEAVGNSVHVIVQRAENSLIIAAKPEEHANIAEVIIALDRSPLEAEAGASLQETLLPLALAKEPQPSANPLWAKIEETEKKLEQTISIDGSMMLHEFVDRMKAAGIYASFDRSVTGEDVVLEGTEFTRECRDVPVSLVLNRVLNPLGLTYTINEDGDLVIMTLGRESEVMLTRVYDAGEEVLRSLLPMLLLPNTTVARVSSEKMLVEAPYSVHKRLEKILASMQDP